MITFSTLPLCLLLTGLMLHSLLYFAYIFFDSIWNLFTFPLIIYQSISTKHIFYEKTTRLSSVAHGVFNYTTSNLVTDLHELELEKRYCKTFQRLDDLLDILRRH